MQLNDAFAGKSDTTATASGGTDRRLIPDKLGDYVTAADFLLAGQTAAQLESGAIDAGPAIRAAISRVGTARLPVCGTYRLDTPVPLAGLGNAIVGGGRNCSTLQITFATGDAITLTGGNTRLRELAITSTVTRTSGNAVHVAGSYGSGIENVFFNGPFFTSLAIDKTNTFKLSHSDFRPGAVNTCVSLLNYPVDTFIDDTNLAACGAEGLLITSGSGIYLTQMDILGSAAGVLVTAANGANVNALYATHVLADSNSNYGWDFEGAGPITEVRCSACWGSGTTAGPGLKINNPFMNDVEFTAFEAHHNSMQGVDLEFGQNITFTGGHVLQNSTAGSALYDGLYAGPGTTIVTISGMHAGSGGYMGVAQKLPNLQRYGINVNNTVPAGIFTVIGNTAFGNVTGGVRVLNIGDRYHAVVSANQ